MKQSFNGHFCATNLALINNRRNSFLINKNINAAIPVICLLNRRINLFPSCFCHIWPRLIRNAISILNDQSLRVPCYL